MDIGKREEQLTDEQALERARKVLGDPAENLAARRTIVSRLGSIARPEAQELLLRHVDDDDPVIVIRAAKALGRLGGNEALERLETAKVPQDPPARRAVEFAKTLLSYRLRLERHLLKAPPKTAYVALPETMTFEIERAEEQALQKAREQLAREGPAVNVIAGAAVKLVCQTTELLLLPVQEQELERRPALAMVVMKRDPSIGGYFVDGYFFTQPSPGGGELELLGTRPGGELTYAGSVRRTESGFSFTVRSVDTPYAAAVDVEGQYDLRTRTFHFTRTLSSRRIAAVERKPAQPQRATPRSERR